jgi:hypothetical protein
MVRAVPVAPRAAAIENPRLTIALIAVIDAQKMNGTVIRNPMMSDHNTQLALWRQTDNSSFDRSVQKSKFMHRCRAL